MKKLAVIFLSSLILSGCSPTNGIITKDDVKNLSYKDVAVIEKRQNEIAYIPEDVELFLTKLKEVRESEKVTDEDLQFLDIRVDDKSYREEGMFMYRLGVDNYTSNSQMESFKKLVSVLDKTIAKGLKQFIETNIETDSEDVVTEKFGRVWVKMEKNDIEDDPHNENSNKLKKDITIFINIRDIKNEDYKKIVNKVLTDDLMLNDIKIGSKEDIIQLSNINYTSYEYHKLNEPAVNYQLFIKEKQLDKVRMVIVTPEDRQINDADLKPLQGILNTFEFNTEDIKNFEELKMSLKGNKKSKDDFSSQGFNFKFSSLENKRYYSQKATTIREIIIEKRK